MGAGKITPPSAGGRQEVTVLLGAHGMNLALAILTQSLLAYALLPEGRGEYAVCVLFGELASLVMALGYNRGAQYFIMTGQLGVSQVLATTLIFCLAGSVIAVPAAVLLVHSDLTFFRNADTAFFYTALWLIPSSFLVSAVIMQLEGLRWFKRLALLHFLRSTAGALAVVAMVWVLDLGVKGALAALVLGNLVMISGGAVSLGRRYGEAWQLPNLKQQGGMLGFGLKEYLGTLGKATDNRLGSLLLGVVGGSRTDIGLFAVGNVVVTRVILLSTAISAYLLPRVAEDGGKRPELTAFCARITWLAAGAALLAWVVVSNHAVPLLLSEAFTPVTRLTWIMSVGILAYAGAGIFAAYFRGVNRPQIYSCAIWVGLVANVIFFLFLYPKWGLSGVAWAMTGGFICRSLVLWGLFHKITGLPISATLLLKRSDVDYLFSSARSLARRARRRGP